MVLLNTRISSTPALSMSISPPIASPAIEELIPISLSRLLKLDKKPFNSSCEPEKILTIVSSQLFANLPKAVWVLLATSAQPPALSIIKPICLATLGRVSLLKIFPSFIALSSSVAVIPNASANSLNAPAIRSPNCPRSSSA